MKKRPFDFVILLFLPMVFVAQTRQTITSKYEIRKSKIKIVYEALKSDTSIKDGSYKYYRNNELLTPEVGTWNFTLPDRS